MILVIMIVVALFVVWLVRFVKCQNYAAAVSSMYVACETILMV